MHFHNWMHSSTSGQVSVFLSASVLLHLDLINLIMQHDEVFYDPKGIRSDYSMTIIFVLKFCVLSHYVGRIVMRFSH